MQSKGMEGGEGEKLFEDVGFDDKTKQRMGRQEQ